MAKKAIEIWWMSIEGLSKADVMPWQSLLDADEHKRASRFTHTQSQIEFIAARALARTALSSISDAPTDAWKFVSRPDGRPFPTLDGRASDCSFNISHTRGMVAVAVSKSIDVGFDLENFGRMADPKIADKAFHDNEKAWLRHSEPEKRRENFLRLWTLKEAYIKATGRGLAQPLDTFWFEKIDPPSMRFSGEIDDNPTAWHFEQHILEAKFVSALAFRDAEGIEPAILWKRCTTEDIKIPEYVR